MFQDFRAVHEEATKAPGYVFDASRAGCWAVVVRVGQTSDVTWAPYRIAVNGRRHEHPLASITYEEVCELAGVEGRPSVVVHRPDGTGSSLSPSISVRVVDGMVFRVAHTGAA